MNRYKKISLAVFFMIAVSFILLNDAFGKMIIHLKDGRSMSVAVSKDDFVGLSFEEGEPFLKSSDITWNFETGNLQGWHKTGSAFDTQPTLGDNPTARHRGQPSKHEGGYWIGSYENRPQATDPPGRIQGDGPQGTLTSRPFRLTTRTVSFLIGGGCDINTQRVELLINGSVVMRATGKCTETMERVSWDVTPFTGQQAQIRLIDGSSGGWGHINFDDVRFE